MFRCQLTGEVSNPREKMIKLIIEDRPKDYINGPPDEPVLSQGREIVREAQVRLVAVDRDAAVRLEITQRPASADMSRRFAELRFEHARKCKKPFEACAHCRANAEWFAQLAPRMLSTVLEERRLR